MSKVYRKVKKKQCAGNQLIRQIKTRITEKQYRLLHVFDDTGGHTTTLNAENVLAPENVNFSLTNFPQVNTSTSMSRARVFLSKINI